MKDKVDEKYYVTLPDNIPVEIFRTTSDIKFFRPIIEESVYEYLRCGDLKEGFARVRCADCEHEYLLSFSCKGRWFCPSCHAKKVIHFGELLKENVLYPVPHRQYVFTIPVMLRVYFKHNRDLLTKLCRCTHESLLVFLRTATGLQTGIPGLVMTIHTFGNYPEKFHPHLHAIVSSEGIMLLTFYTFPPHMRIDAFFSICYHVIKYVITGGSMVRTQIQLTEEQAKTVRAIAKSRHLSVAELIRQAIDMVIISNTAIDIEERQRRAKDIAGKFSSDSSDVSRDHDRYLAEAFKK